MKTNNPKAKNLQTPAPFGTIKTNRRQSTAQKLKKAAPVTQQPQLKVHSDAVVDEVPDIEYMPPKPRGMSGPVAPNAMNPNSSTNEPQIFQISQTT